MLILSLIIVFNVYFIRHNSIQINSLYIYIFFFWQYWGLSSGTFGC
jgi:hypothetical protein